MKKQITRHFCAAICMLIVFVLWTIAVRCIDVRAIGPQKTTVGFAAINSFVHNLTGVHMLLYTVTDWLGLVPFAFVTGFGVLGLIQLIRRKHFLKVDNNLLVLGVFYIIVMIIYAVFELFVVNYRPVLINGCLEASYPSSTTMLVMCVMPTAIMQFNVRIKNTVIRRLVATVMVAFIVFMVVARLVSGVHWFTDIVGGVLVSTGLVFAYCFFCNLRLFSTRTSKAYFDASVL